MTKQPHNKNLLVGFDTADDAGVYKLTDEIAIVQTVDFITPIVDDPYIYGRIAANNSVSDVWAMGGEAITALSIANFPVHDVEMELIGKILCGGADLLAEMNVCLMGGHSVEDKEPKFGYAVTGIVHPDKIITNAGARPGDLLYLTKPLGTGIITTGIKLNKVSAEIANAAIEQMVLPNRAAARAMQEAGAHAATDITGFGLMGHAYEVAKGSGVTLLIDPDRVPLLPEVLELAAAKVLTRGDRRNREYVGDTIEFQGEVSRERQSALFDPQTAGGLLISIAAQQRSAFESALARHNSSATLIGQVMAFSGKSLKIIPGLL